MGEWWMVVWYEEGHLKSYRHSCWWKVERMADSLRSEGFKVTVYGYLR